MLFTLIIAAYNIQDYIGECLESCLNQDEFSHDDYEIIVINDGSKDSTKKIVEEYGRNYPNIRLITQDNAGLSAARNTGIRNAKGDYIWFIDGDDKISKNALSILSKNIKQNAADAYLIDYTEFYEEQAEKPTDVSFNLQKQFSPINHLATVGLLPMMAWLTIYSHSFIKKFDLRFTEGIIHEDLDFSVRCFSLLSNGFHIPENLYLYRKNRPGSIMNKPRRNQRSIHSLLQIEKVWIEYFNLFNISKNVKANCFSTLSYFILLNPYFKYVNKDKRNSKKRYYGYLWNGSYKDKIKTLILIMFPHSMSVKLLKQQ